MRLSSGRTFKEIIKSCLKIKINACMEEFYTTKRAVGMMLMLALGPGDYVLTQYGLHVLRDNLEIQF